MRGEGMTKFKKASSTILVSFSCLSEYRIFRPNFFTVISNKNAVENVRHTWKPENNDLEVKWDPPRDSTTVDHYTVALHRENVKIQTEETKNTEITFKNLEPCANHKITFNSYDRDQVTKYKTVHYLPETLLKGKAVEKFYL